ncbi:MAG: hypothetical protein WCW26_04430, partial [Candidatus Buchananbacteria bacterium]
IPLGSDVSITGEAWDEYDGNVSSTLVVQGADLVDPDLAGTYPVEFSAHDQSANVVTAKVLYRVLPASQLFPRFWFTEVANIGTDETVMTGKAFGFDPTQYGVAIYGQDPIAKDWYLMSALTMIDDEGVWSTDLTFSSVNLPTTQIAGYVVSLDTVLPDRFVGRPYFEQAVACSTISRSWHSYRQWYVTLTGLPDAASGNPSATGLVSWVGDKPYEIVAYSNVGWRWWLKTEGRFWSEPIRIDPETGDWSAQIVKYEHDSEYSEATFYVVPQGTEIDSCWSNTDPSHQGCQFMPNIPEAVAFISVPSNYQPPTGETGDDPAITLTYLPSRVGSDTTLSGIVAGVDFAKYRIGAYLFGADSVWYPKPDVDYLAVIDSQGNFSIQIATNPYYDQYARKVVLYLVPQGTDMTNCWPELCLELPTVPRAVASLVIDL